MPDRFKVLQSTPTIVFLNKLSRPRTCQLHTTCSSNIFQFEAGVFFSIHCPPLIWHCDPCGSMHFIHFWTPVALRRYTSLLLPLLLLGLERLKMTLHRLVSPEKARPAFPECRCTDAMVAGVKTVGFLTLHSDGTVFHPGF